MRNEKLEKLGSDLKKTVFKFTCGDWIEENMVLKECGFGGRVLIFLSFHCLCAGKRKKLGSGNGKWNYWEM